MSAATAAGTKYLQPVSGAESVIISALEGKRTIANDGKKLFSGYLDSDFRNWGANETGGSTPETAVTVYEMKEDANHATMFGSLSDNVESLVLTQDQILTFVEENRDKLRTGGYATFFLFKSEGKLFIVYVCVYDDGSLKASVLRFDNDIVWNAPDRRRVVVPQLRMFLPPPVREFSFPGLSATRRASCRSRPAPQRESRSVLRKRTCSPTRAA